MRGTLARDQAKIKIGENRNIQDAPIFGSKQFILVSNLVNIIVTVVSRVTVFIKFPTR